MALQEINLEELFTEETNSTKPIEIQVKWMKDEQGNLVLRIPDINLGQCKTGRLEGEKWITLAELGSPQTGGRNTGVYYPVSGKKIHVRLAVGRKA